MKTRLGKNVRTYQRITACGLGSLEIGDGSTLGYHPSPGFKHGEFYIEARKINAKITIGKNVHINNNAIIIAENSEITIGNNTLVGPNFFCVDSNFHHPNPEKRKQKIAQDSKPTKIGENTFIGSNVSILRGSTIGSNCTIGAGCTINGIVPDNTTIKQYTNNDEQKP